MLDIAPALPTSHYDLGMDLQAAIEELPPGARTVFVLHDVEGYRHEEIGEMLDISTGTSKSQLHRARQTLRGRLMKKTQRTVHGANERVD